MSLTLQGWKNSTTLLVIQKLPLQDNQSASILSATYLSDTGGWLPYDEDDPTGAGEPVNRENPDVASSNIAVNQYQRMYDITSNEAIVVKIKFNTNFTAEQSDSAVMSATRNDIELFITEQLSDTMLELVSVENVSYDMFNRGMTISTDRVAIQHYIATTDKLTDPKAIGLVIARNNYMLDDTYNVSSVYKEEETELVIEVRKYQDTQYTALDRAVSNRYVLTLDSENYTLSTGIVLPE